MLKTVNINSFREKWAARSSTATFTSLICKSGEATNNQSINQNFYPYLIKSNQPSESIVKALKGQLNIFFSTTEINSTVYHKTMFAIIMFDVKTSEIQKKEPVFRKGEPVFNIYS